MANTKKAAVKKVSSVQATKSVAKKAVVKPASSKTTRKAAKQVKLLVCAPDDKCFWTTDGSILKNLEELKFAFGTMDEEVFLHHVTKDKNDFADWVEHVLQDAACAEDLRKSKKPSTAVTVVVKHLRHYNA